MSVKKLGLVSLLILALMLAACADGGAAQTPGAFPTDSGLGTDAGLPTTAATDVLEPTVAATTPATMEATTEGTLEATADTAGTPVGAATTEVESGIVALPFSMFTVASLTGDTTGGMEDSSTPMAGTQPAGTEPAAAGTQPAASGTEPAGELSDAERLLVRASELLGSEVVTMQGDKVGTVNEVLVNDTGAIQYVVVDASAFMEGTSGETETGTGAGTPAAGTPEPIGTLDNSTQVVGTIEPEGTTAAGTEPAAGTPESVATSTVGEGTAVAEPGVVADEDTILILNGSQDDLMTQGIVLPQSVLDMDGAMIDVSGGDIAADMGMLNGLWRVSGLGNGNANVLDAQDQDLGEVEDLLVDIRQGMLEYGVVDFGGFLGIAESTVAVPWEQFTLPAAGADASLMLDVTEDTLQNAPQLNIGEWPSWPERIPMEWETETQTFWETAS